MGTHWLSALNPLEIEFIILPPMCIIKTKKNPVFFDAQCIESATHHGLYYYFFPFISLVTNIIRGESIVNQG